MRACWTLLARRAVLLAALLALLGGRPGEAGEAALVTATSRWEDAIRILPLNDAESGLRIELVSEPEQGEEGLTAEVVLHVLRDGVCYWPEVRVREASAPNALQAVAGLQLPVLGPHATSQPVQVPLPGGSDDGEWALHGACMPRLVRVIGGRGGPTLDLNKPRGLAVLPDGGVVVADKGNDRIVTIGREGGIQESWKRATGDDLAFSHPVDIDRDPVMGTLYVADLNNRRIVVMDAKGKLLRTLPAPEEEPLGRPVDLALDAARGRVYVLDAAVPGLVVLDVNGRRAASWGGFDTVGLKLSIPLDVELDAEGRPLVSDGGTGAVHMLSPVDGRPVADFGLNVNQGVALRYPSAIAALPDGRLLIADFAADRVRLLSADGRESSWFGVPGEFPGGVNYPADAKLVGDLLYVTETATDTVSVFDVGEWIDRNSRGLNGASQKRR